MRPGTIAAPTVTAAQSTLRSGGADGGRRFRPDIEGLRAIAVGLVLVFHAYGTPFSGGFVGVDVFFVISGFLITSILLREHSTTGRVSILGFYGRRVRRILPASALVVVTTVVAAYYFLGFLTGNDVAVAAKWTAVFAANIHFGLVGTDYFGSQLPPSPLLHMWSLGVEEQFYVVWPGVFLALVSVVGGTRLRRVLAGSLIAIIAASFAWSVFETAADPTWAYFSPFTRASELGLGALIAVLGPELHRKLKQRWAAEGLASCGLAGIAGSALLLNSSTPYPGAAIAWPVVGTALLIAAGCTDTRTFVERGLSLRPMQWFGARSYSLYLWHWPILTIAAQYVMRHTSGWQTTGLLLLTILASALSYRWVENPVRRAQSLTARPGLSLAVGAALIAITIALAQVFIVHSGGARNLFDSPDITKTSCPSSACSDIPAQVASGAKTDTIPPDLTPSLADAAADMRVPDGGRCSPLPISWLKPDRQPCIFDTGARANAPMIILIGDSEAVMWSRTVHSIATRLGYRFGLVFYYGCHMPMITFDTTREGVTDAQCREWKTAAINWMKRQDPSVVIVASGNHTGFDDDDYAAGYAAVLKQMQGPGRKLFVMGDVPLLSQDPPRCLAAHPSSALTCATKTATAAPADEQQAALAGAQQAGAGFVNLTPWLCTADLCPAIVGHYAVYQDQFHITGTYAQALMPLVQQAIGLKPVG
ncbi:acyltransferase family protein [Mycobacterium sp.]|uniref:acyltransferase family protein n=1 Tax=Mycobacterium sp. TaxID=1785 RepID=UPI003BAFF1DE